MLNKFIWNILLIFTFSNSAFYLVIFNSSGHFFHLILPMIFIFSFYFQKLVKCLFSILHLMFPEPLVIKKKPDFVYCADFYYLPQNFVI